MALASTYRPSARPRSGSRARRRRRPHSAPVLVLVLLALAALCYHLLINGYMSSDALARYAKLLVMRDAAGLRLEFAGFLSTQVSVYLGLLFSWVPGMPGVLVPYLLDIAAMSLFASLAWRDMTRDHGPWWAWAWTLLLVCHPFTLWIATSGHNLGLGTLAVYGLFRTLRSFRGDPEPRVYLRFAGWLCLLFFVDERAAFIALAMLPWLALVAPRGILQRAPLAFYLICYLPFVFALLGWMYMNWLFFGDSLMFITREDSAFRGGYADAPYLPWLLEFGGQWFRPLLWLTVTGALSFPSLLLAFWSQQRGWAGTLTVAGTLLCAGAMATLTWFATQALDFLALLIVPAALGLRALFGWQRIPATVLLLLAIPLGWLILLREPLPEVRQWSVAFGESVEQRSDEDIRLGAWLAETRLPTLIDDRAAYRVIAARRDAKQLILPFDDRFKLALTTRGGMPAQIVVARPGSLEGAQDSISQRFPQLWESGMPGYQLKFEGEVWRVWQREP